MSVAEFDLDRRVSEPRYYDQLDAGFETIRNPVFTDESRRAAFEDLARRHRSVSFSRDTRLLERLRENALRLKHGHQQLILEWNPRTQPGGLPEWILDNFHILKESTEEIRRDLPKRFYVELPRCDAGDFPGDPRIYELAVLMVACSDGSLDGEYLQFAIEAYQNITPLTMGEIWAIPTMLRMVLVENLRRLVDRFYLAHGERIRAQLVVGGNHQSALNQASFHREVDLAIHEGRRFATVFLAEAVEAAYLLEDADGRGVGTVSETLAKLGVHPAEVIRDAQAIAAADRVSTGNSITSLRVLNVIDWNEFFEDASFVEAILRRDPSGVYAEQDKRTRDRCRHAVEEISKRWQVTELDVARRVLTVAEASDGNARHVGYHLLGQGHRRFENEFSPSGTLLQRMQRFIRANRAALYLASILALWLILMAPWSGVAGSSFGLTSSLILLALCVPVSEIAVATMNFLLLQFLPPRPIPQLDTSKGLPAESSTIVVIPCLLTSIGSVKELIGKLERHYLSNRDPNLWFALLADFADSTVETQPNDEEILRAASVGIQHLNNRYREESPNRFFLFHRSRQWNASENKWMGWERKRGKLEAFAKWLRDRDGKEFSFVSEGASRLPSMRFVLTLDVDTMLPPDTARRLVGAASHPLNQPVVDAKTRTVVEGYTFFQPRVDVSLSASRRSLFTLIHARSDGIDPYAVAASDIYQDVFGAGSFVGKGLFQVDSLLQTLEDRFPENRILSHDLIEGNFARCALVSDVQFMDEYPSQVFSYLRREHRWIRGDWQILPYLLPWLPGRKRNPLGLIERWKILDNLRRSLIAPSLLAILLLSWFSSAGKVGLSVSIVLATLFFPTILSVVHQVLAFLRSGRRAWKRTYPKSLLATFLHGIVETTFLLEKARCAIDAIVRTCYRLVWSRKHLLQWETSAATEKHFDGSLSSQWRTFWTSPVFALLLALAVWARPLPILLTAVPLLLLWINAPLMAYLLGRRFEPAKMDLTADERADLRRWARKTWSFFETTVNEVGHWLPPDNYQEIPTPKLAMRTSPTNIAMYLLSNVGAHDLGFIGAQTMVDRIEHTTETLNRLHKWNGHLLNWYSTETLEPLAPAYVSTVDSGNLLGGLLTTAQALEELVTAKVDYRVIRAGLQDSLRLAEIALERDRENQKLDTVLNEQGQKHLPRLWTIFEVKPANALEFNDWLTRLIAECQTFLASIPGGNGLHDVDSTSNSTLRWLCVLARDAAAHHSDLIFFHPWLPIVHERPDLLNEAITRGPDSPCTVDDWHRMRMEVACAPSLQLLIERMTQWKECHCHLRTSEPLNDQEVSTSSWLIRFEQSLDPTPLLEFRNRVEKLARSLRDLATSMDFRPLYHSERRLFSIGCNVALDQLDRSYYDLMASEASLTSFLSVALGHAPREHWFQLVRSTTGDFYHPALISWGGTMFEYLMPRLLLRPPEATLLAASHEAAIDQQIAYARSRNVPWGISESAYAALNAGLDYQYQAFGIPSLGLKRGLMDDLVVAPYASMLALMIRPKSSIQNLRKLAEIGAEGDFGFYEAVDFSSDRSTPDGKGEVVQTFMAHHQGMSLLAIVNCLFDDVMPRRLHREPAVRSAELLLEEKIPFELPRQTIEHQQEAPPKSLNGEAELPVLRKLATPHTSFPRSHLLSNGELSLFVSHAGGTRTKFNNIDLTRWRSDRLLDNHGYFIYLRAMNSGRVWSSTYQPIRAESEVYEVLFSEDKAEFKQVDDAFETQMEIVVSPEDAVELRVVRVINRGSSTEMVEWTSFAPLALSRHADDLAHPAFQNLFVETDYLANGTLLAHRRPRSEQDLGLWAFHAMSCEGDAEGLAQFETDRRQFVGRNRRVDNPAALFEYSDLTGTIGPVLDPMFSLRCRRRIRPGESAEVTFVLGMGRSREEAVMLADKYKSRDAIFRAVDVALQRGSDDRKRLRISPYQEQLFQRLSAQLLYPGPDFRAHEAVLSRSALRASDLGRIGAYGEYPIVVAHVYSEENLAFARDLILAHAFWRTRGLQADLVFIDQHESGYFEEIQRQLREFVRSALELDLLDRPGGVHLRHARHLAEEELDLIRSCACCEFNANDGSLSEQINRLESRIQIRHALPAERRSKSTDKGAVRRSLPSVPSKSIVLRHHASDDGRSYHIHLEGSDASPSRRSTPMPWSNVIANPTFGFLVTEAGGGFTWSENSQTNRLTPWSNDPICDPPGEVVYLRNESTGKYWSATPEPVRGSADQHVVHGSGYTSFAQVNHELESELIVFAAPNDPVKFYLLRLVNRSAKTMEVSATLYLEWVLGTNRDKNSPHVVTEVEEDKGVLLAHNRFNPDYPERVAFVDTSVRPRTYTCDRQEFLGRHGGVHRPIGMSSIDLSGTAGARLDPCAAVRVFANLNPNATETIVFVLGQATDRDEAVKLASRYRHAPVAHAVLESVHDHWEDILGGIQIRTPSKTFDVMVNQWLLYQTISCRFWGRSGFYQSGGAFGFRDQLQDSLALLHTASNETRRHLLLCASRQFEEGDVQHWWHPPFGAGVRTRITDDLLWLPYAVTTYVETTGDASILDETAPFLTAPELQPGQEDDYRVPEVSTVVASLYEHCLRAIRRACRLGAHGLPLIGTGDWNDGMNRVGPMGKGESIFNAWFLLTNLRRFAEVARTRADLGVSRELETLSASLASNIEQHAWDGEWYLRAFFDDGSAVGSSANRECQIDSIAQSWGVISGEADSTRSNVAMNSVMTRLVDRNHRLVKLFDPPFHDSHGKPDPGYVQGYVPGIRENGGQYTHAATWVVLALIKLGRADDAFDLFQILNPLERAKSAELLGRYLAEPYVLAGDVYGAPPHMGRGGWTWYTGSCGWMYRIAIENILGIKRRGTTLEFEPSVPSTWERFSVRYRFGRATYEIEFTRRADRDAEDEVHSSNKPPRVIVDDEIASNSFLVLRDDEAVHRVNVVW